MELDELKHQLKSRLSGGQQKSDNDIQLLLRKKTQSALNKLKRNIFLEIMFSAFFALLFIGIALFANTAGISIYFSIFSVVMVVFFAVLMYLHRQTKQALSAEGTVKATVEKFINVLETYVKRSFQFTMLLVPVCFLLAFWLAYDQPGETVASNAFQFSTKKPLRYLGSAFYILLVSGLTYYLTRWYLRKMFGNYIAKLKLYMQELEQD